MNSELNITADNVVAAPDLLEQAKQEDIKKRMEGFQTEFKRIIAQYQITVQPKITPDGPIISIIDIKNGSSSEQSSLS